MNTKISSEIISVASYLPEKILTNDDLSKFVDTNDEWITTRTGIKQRHIAADNQLTSDLAYEAALRLLKNANVNALDIDMIIVATTTPDNSFPSTATKLQAMIGAKNAFAFDVQAVCAGFVYALTIANNFIKSGEAKKVLVIGAETLSRILDWQDRTTCVLFGDGAGAFLLGRTEISDYRKDSAIYDSKLYSDGTLTDILYTDGGVSLNKRAGVIKMLGKEVFKNAVSKMADVALEIIEKNNFSLSDIDFIIPHQANIRIIEAIAKRLGVSEDQVITTVTMHANTSAASIPLATDFAMKTNRLKKGDLVVFDALGAGLTWGSVLARL